MKRSIQAILCAALAAAFVCGALWGCAAPQFGSVTAPAPMAVSPAGTAAAASAEPSSAPTAPSTQALIDVLQGAGGMPGRFAAIAMVQQDLAAIAGGFAYFLDRAHMKVEWEQAIVAALNSYGDLNMAQSFLNSGRDALETAAYGWAASHHVTIIHIY